MGNDYSDLLFDPELHDYNDDGVITSAKKTIAMNLSENGTIQQGECKNE